MSRNLSIGRQDRSSLVRFNAVALLLIAPLVLPAMLGASSPASAACTSNAPASGSTVTCDGIDNAGVINAAADAVNVTVQSAGTISTGASPAIVLRDSNIITNSGSIVVTDGVAAISVDGSGGGSSITNNGSIAVGDGSTGISALYNNHIFNNGLIAGGARSIGIFVNGFSGGNVVVNTGTIGMGDGVTTQATGVEMFNPGNSLSNSGIISVGNAVSSTVAAVFVDDQNNTVTNSGLIVAGNAQGANASGVLFSFAGTNDVLNNSGTITVGNAVGGTAAGVSIQVAGVTVNNSGTITAGSNGFGVFTTTGSNIVNNLSAGAISTGLSGIGIGMQGAGNIVTNSGTIRAGTAGFGFGISVGSTGNVVTNSGTITVGHDGIGIFAVNGNNTGSGITNSGTIVAGDNGAGIQVLNLNNITNSGTIRVGSNGNSLVGGNNNTVDNSGTLDGGLSLNGTGNQLNNSGLITITAATVTGTSLFVGGGFQQGANGTLSLRVGNLAFGYDSMAVTGVASLDGKLRAAVQVGLYANSTTYLSVLQSGSRVGSFAQGTSSSPFFTATAIDNGNNVDLKLDRIAFNAVSGLTKNQLAVGGALEAQYSPAVTGNAATLYGNLLGSTQSAGATFNQISGEGLTQAQQSAFFTSSLFMSAIMDQALPWHGGEILPNPGGGLAMGYAPERPEPPVFKTALKGPRIEPLSPWRVWAAGFGGSQTLRGDGGDGTAGSNAGAWGGAFGVEKRLSNWLTAGVSIGASDSNFSVSERATTGKAIGGHIAGYATAAFGQTYLSGLLSYSHLANTTTRTVSILALNETLQGKFGSDQVGTRIELGHRMAFDAYNVTPFVALQYSRLWQAGFSETPTAGAGVFALTLPSQSISSLPLFVGVQFDKRYVFSGMVLSPYLRASLVHEFEPARQINAAFAAVPGASFTVDGPRVASNSAKLDLGAKLALTRSTMLFGDFSSEFSDRGHSFGGTGGVKVIW